MEKMNANGKEMLGADDQACWSHLKGGKRTTVVMRLRNKVPSLRPWAVDSNTANDDEFKFKMIKSLV